MVTYHKFVSVVFETAKKKGANTSEQAINQSIMQVAAEVWNRRKSELQTASIAEAKRIADSEVSVQ